MKAVIYVSNTTNNNKNCFYPNKVIIGDEQSACLSFSHDYVCAKYMDNYRSQKNFISSSLLPFDIDNDHSENEKEWITPSKVAEFFTGVPFIVHYSKNNMKEKNGKKARPKFHVIFPIKEITDEKEYARYKERLYVLFPYVDSNALDSARYFNGTENPKVEFYGGTRTIDKFIENEEKSYEYLTSDEIPEGKRNSTMLQIAVRILKRDGDTKATKDLFIKESKRCNPPLESNELSNIWKQALKYYEKIKLNPDYKAPGDYQKVEFDEIIPLPDVVLPEFPVNSLPSAIKNYCLEVAESTQTPPDMAFVSALAIIALAMQKNYKVVGKADWEEQLSLYVMIVAEPSDRKSAVLSQMIKVINAFEANYNETHSLELEKNHDEYYRLTSAKAKVLKNLEKGKATQDEYDDLLEKISKFKKLNRLTLTLDDVTSESIATKMSEQGGCIAIVSSEGGMVDIISGLYSKNVNIDVYLKGYSGDSLKVDRIGRESLYIPSPRLTILLTVQPKVLESFITNPIFSGRGLTARFLYSIPKSKVGSRKFNTNPINYDSKQAFNELINSILSETSNFTTYIHLSSDASRLLESYHDKFEIRLAGDLREIGAWAGKLLGNILRLSAIINRSKGIKYDEFTGLASTNDDAVWIIQKDDMEGAIAIGEYFLEHALCAFNLLGVDQRTKDAKTIISILRNHEPKLTEVNVRTIARLTRRVGKKERIAPVLSTLADYGYLKEKVKSYENDRSRSDTYLVNPKIYEDDDKPP